MEREYYNEIQTRCFFHAIKKHKTVEGAVLGIKALKGAKLLGKMLAGGGVAFLTEGISK